MSRPRPHKSSTRSGSKSPRSGKKHKKHKKTDPAEIDEFAAIDVASSKESLDIPPSVNKSLGGETLAESLVKSLGVGALANTFAGTFSPSPVEPPVAATAAAVESVNSIRTVKTEALAGVHGKPNSIGRHNSECPPGLECLLKLKLIKIKQERELVTMVHPKDNCNTYNIVSESGEKILFAREISKHFFAECFRKQRKFRMNIYDSNNHIVIMVITAQRPFRCCSNCISGFCCMFCRQVVEVDCPPGISVGVVQENCSLLRNSFTIKDDEEKDILSITGPWCKQKATGYCAGKSTFTIEDQSKKIVGMIRREREVSLPVDQLNEYTVTFPEDLDVRRKASLICNTILIDFMYYEYEPKRPIKQLVDQPSGVAQREHPARPHTTHYPVPDPLYYNDRFNKL